MTQRPQDTSAEEPDGGNPHIRFRGGPGLGNQPGLLNKLSIETQMVQVHPGQSRSWQVGSECCHSLGDRRVSKRT